MRVLVVHNQYRSAMPSGENAVVRDEVELLRRAGVDVYSYIRGSDELQYMSRGERAALALRPVYSRKDTEAVEGVIRGFRPDILHVHNPYPLISPWVVRTAKRLGVPVVVSIHNHRLVCSKSTYFRDGHICRDCASTRLPWPSVLHGCYRDSRPQSAVMAVALTAH